MENETEYSEGGSQIYRYTVDDVSNEKFVPAFYEDVETYHKIEQHIEKYLGEPKSVFHELLSNYVHIDVHYIEPNNERPFHTFVTTGMSDKPMNLPEGAPFSPYAELMIRLPKEWPVDLIVKNLSKPDECPEDAYWPIRQLKYLARFPHAFNSWLGFYHTIPNGDPAEPYASNTKLNCMMVVPAMFGPPQFFECQINNGKTVRFFTLIPLYQEEMDFKLTKGGEALFDKLLDAGVSDIVYKDRPNVCKRKKWFGFFS